MRFHDAEHTTLTLARARPRPTDVKPEFYWFASGADCEKVGNASQDVWNSPIVEIANQMVDKEIVKLLPVRIRAREILTKVREGATVGTLADKTVDMLSEYGTGYAMDIMAPSLKFSGAEIVVKNIASTLVKTVRDVRQTRDQELRDDFDKFNRDFGGDILFRITRFAQLRDGKPTLLILDDFDELDPLSRQAFFSRIPPEGLERLLIVITLREGADATKYLLNEIRRLDRLPASRQTVLRLGLPTRSALREDLFKELGPIPEEVFDYVYDNFGDGNPIVVREIVQFLFGWYGGSTVINDATGHYAKNWDISSLKRHLGVVEQGAVGLKTIFERICEIAFGALADEAQRLLRAAAFFGDRFERELLVHLLKRHRLRTAGNDAVSTPEIAIDELLASSALIDVPSNGLPHFKGRFLRHAVLHRFQNEIRSEQVELVSEYIRFIVKDNRARFRTGHDASMARIVLSLERADGTFDPRKEEMSRLAPPKEPSSPLLDRLLAAVQMSIDGPIDSSKREDAGLHLANEILIGAADYWSMVSVRASEEDEAVRNLWALHEILVNCDPREEFALARAHSAILRLRIWVNDSEANALQRTRRIDFAKLEAKAARSASRIHAGEAKSMLELKAIELDLLAAEAYLLDYRNSSKARRKKKEASSGRLVASFGLKRIEEAIRKLAPANSSSSELAAIKSELRQKELSEERKRELRDRMADLLLEDDNNGAERWPQSMLEAVDFLRVRAMERLVQLSQWFTSEETLDLDIDLYRSELVAALRRVVIRHKSGTDPHSQVWALRRLGRALHEMSAEWTGDISQTGLRSLSISYAQEAVESFGACYDKSPASNVAMELLHAIERVSEITENRNALAELRSRLGRLAQHMAVGDRQSFLLTEAGRIDRFIRSKGDERWSGWTSSLWQRYRAGDKTAAFMGNVFSAFGDLQKSSERKAVARELFSAPELADLDVLGVLIASVRNQPFANQDAIVDILDNFERRAMSSNWLSSAAPHEIEALRQNILQVASALGRTSPRARLGVLSLQMRLQTHRVLGFISSGSSAEAVAPHLDEIEREFRSMEMLTDALHDTDAQQLLIELWSSIAEWLLSKARDATGQRMFYFFLRDQARSWFDRLESRLETSNDLAQLEGVWGKQAEFHREFGNLFEATTLGNKIERLRRYDRFGPVVGGLLYRAADTELDMRGRDPFRDTRLLLEAVLRTELSDYSHEISEIDSWRMRERLAAMLWQNARARQPRSIREEIPLLPTEVAIAAFAGSDNGPGELISDIVQLWASDPPKTVVPGTMISTRIVAVHAAGLEVADSAQRRYLVREKFLPVKYFHFHRDASIALAGEALDHALKDAGLHTAMVIVVLGDKENRQFESDFGVPTPYLLGTSRGRDFVETVLPCLLPKLRKRLTVGASNSSVAVFVAATDLSLFTLGGGLVHQQITDRLLNLRRFAAVPLITAPKSAIASLDVNAMTQQELSDFVRVFWADLTLVDLRSDRSEAIFELTIGAPVAPRKERTTRSMLKKAFPGIKRFTIIGGILEDRDSIDGEADDESAGERHVVDGVELTYDDVT